MGHHPSHRKKVFLEVYGLTERNGTDEDVAPGLETKPEFDSRTESFVNVSCTKTSNIWNLLKSADT